MRWLLVLLVGCSAPFEAGVGVAGSDAAGESDAGGAQDAQDEPGRARQEAGARADGGALEAAVEAAGLACPAFPDGGWTCGSTPIGAPGIYVCATHGDAGGAVENAAPRFCDSGCVSCATCDMAALCDYVWQAKLVACSEPGGRVSVTCR